MKHRNKKPRRSNGRALMVDMGYRRKERQLKKLEAELKATYVRRKANGSIRTERIEKEI